MKVVRGGAEARWLPSRHRFALFRLNNYRITDSLNADVIFFKLQAFNKVGKSFLR